jgi:cell division initiation protein
MTLTPVEVRHLELRRGLLGYRRSHVHRTIEEIADSFEDVWRERSELTERVHDLEGEVARHVELETLLRSTLVSAERAAQDMKEHARREADVIVQEAGAEGRRLIRDAIAEKEQLLAETRRVRSIMRAALDVLAEGQEIQGENDRDEPAERAEAATPRLTEPPAASTEVDRLAG